MEFLRAKIFETPKFYINFDRAVIFYKDFLEQHAPAERVTDNLQVSSVHQGGTNTSVGDYYYSTKEYKSLSQEHHMDLERKHEACRHNTTKIPKLQEKINNDTKQMKQNISYLLKTIRIKDEGRYDKGKDDHAKDNNPLCPNLPR